MKPEEMKDKTFDALKSTVSLLIQNNALLQSLADLMIKTESKGDDKYEKELSEYFEKRLKENRELAADLLAEVSDS